jgi:phosphatidylglycerophosphate synthase
MAQEFDGVVNRRPIASRNTKWAAAVARGLARAGIRPNVISLFSIVFAACSGGCFLATRFCDGVEIRVALYIGAAVFIQLRLLCNLFDGMVAVEGGFKTKSGEVFNDCPDRIADPCVLIGAGYAVSSFSFAATLGWAAALLAVLTAYVRVLGVSCGTKQHFLGPMAKQHRMAAMTVAAVLAAIEALASLPPRVVAVALVVIVLGCLVTVMRRLSVIVKEMEAK